MLLTVGVYAQPHYGGSIAWLSNSATNDSTYFKNLRVLGYTVTPKLITSTMLADSVAKLENFDLVVISRNSTSGNYPPANFHELKTPIIIMSSLIPRTGKWKMLNTDSEETAKKDLMRVMNPEHPIFSNIVVNADGTIDIAKSDYSGFSLMKTIKNAGNGSTLGVASTDSLLMIGEWNAETVFSSTTTYSAKGKRMVPNQPGKNGKIYNRVKKNKANSGYRSKPFKLLFKNK